MEESLLVNNKVSQKYVLAGAFSEGHDMRAFYQALYGLDIGDRKNLEDGLRLVAKNFRNS